MGCEVPHNVHILLGIIFLLMVKNIKKQVLFQRLQNLYGDTEFQQK